MICPLKFNFLAHYQIIDYEKAIETWCSCEKEKCAWWVDWDNENEGCALEILAINSIKERI